MIVGIRLESAPALGDVRQLPAGSWIYVFPNAKERPDWARYLDAITSAVAGGSSVSWLEGAT
ncbi:hypothetical protein E0L36_26720 [Streptomyces sp. AJS327]|nr:hypothetical protein [Streptomyces sp. AJS327]